MTFIGGECGIIEVEDHSIEEVVRWQIGKPLSFKLIRHILRRAKAYPAVMRRALSKQVEEMRKLKLIRKG